MKMRHVLLITALLATAAAAQDRRSDPASCESCHAAAVPDAAPRLNGQSADYIVARLRAFHDLTTQSPHATLSMWDTATSLGASKTAELAKHFAAQAPTPATAAGALADAGRRLYVQDGCQSCHGAKGEGLGSAPRLAGQRPVYLRRQLATFSLGTRYHANMLHSTWTLSNQDMTAIAAFLGAD